MVAIADKFGLEPIFPMPKLVKEFDNRILITERDQIMEKPPLDWGIALPPIEGLILPLWSPDEAEYWFLEQFRRLYVH
jgi:hypothetical protein